MRKLTFTFLFLLISVTSTTIFAQHNYRSPLEIPLLLSANFGELRVNHFHTGLDLKTQGVINKNVYSIEDGYVSRIGINAGGYGLVLYVDHPNGQTSVYAHLNGFAPSIARFVKSEQYKQERYTIDIANIDPRALPVRKGDLIARSGNSGSSGGPHVHFEIRDTKSELTLDPLPYYKGEIEDKLAPEIRGIAVYPMEGKGIVNGSASPYRRATQSQKFFDGTIEAWGQIGVGICAVDRMSGVNNVFGVAKVRLFCDGEKIFSSEISSVDFGTTRMINSLTDFDYWKKDKKVYMKSFIEPGNNLHIYDKTKNGCIDIDEERTYNLRYELEDLYGNQTDIRFAIQGKKGDIPQSKSCSLVMQWDTHNRYIGNHFSLTIPPGYLYKDINFLLSSREDSRYYSQVYKVHSCYEPLNDYVEMSFRILGDTALFTPDKYGVVSIDQKGKESWVGGVYKDGYITTKIRELGNSYAASIDTIAPAITPVNSENWLRSKRVTIRLTDNMSGIKNFRGTINDKYVLFKHDIKSSNYTYDFDDERLEKGQMQHLRFTATDSAGNSAEYEYTFDY